jgi:hypothetical protein
MDIVIQVLERHVKVVQQIVLVTFHAEMDIVTLVLEKLVIHVQQIVLVTNVEMDIVIMEKIVQHVTQIVDVLVLKFVKVDHVLHSVEMD